MRNRRRSALARAGFTLVEVLVTLVLLALLLGVIVPSVINQLGAGEPARVAGDLESMRSATRLFRVDVRRFPGTPEQLVLPPAEWGDSTDHSGNVIPDALTDQWDGPYLETGSLIPGATGGTATPDTLLIGLSGQVDADFATGSLNTNNWLTVGVTNYTVELTQQVSEVIDGDTVVTAGATAGRVQWDGVDRLVYFLVPLN